MVIAVRSQWKNFGMKITIIVIPKSELQNRGDAHRGWVNPITEKISDNFKRGAAR